MKILFIVSEGSYGNQNAYNALRVALMVQIEHPEVNTQIFLMGDGVACSPANQLTPEGYYSLEKMLATFISKGGQVKVLTTSLEIRGMVKMERIKGIKLATMSDLAKWTVEADKLISI